MTHRHDTDESGVVLVLLMLIVVLLGTASLTIASTSRDTFAATSLDASRIEAQAALDGALATARHRLRTDPGWRGSVEQVADHRIETSVEPLGDGYLVALRARGSAPDGCRLAARAELGASADPSELPQVRRYATALRFH